MYLLKEHSVVVDRRCRKVVETLDRDITDFAEVDATGQVFRYPFGRENLKRLTDLAIINLGVLWKKFGGLIENLRTMNYVGDSLRREYVYETYTAHLSRFDLICVAYRLPPRHYWNTHEFDEAKKDIRQRFDLSSNEFARAVHLIKEKLDMAAIIEGGAASEAPPSRSEQAAKGNRGCERKKRALEKAPAPL